MHADMGERFYNRSHQGSGTKNIARHIEDTASRTEDMHENSNIPGLGIQEFAGLLCKNSPNKMDNGGFNLQKV